MKIALIQPYFFMKESARNKSGKYKMFNLRLESYPPLGLCYLSSYLKFKGISEVEIIDCIERGYDSKECSAYISRNKFDVVGITVTSFTLKEVSEIIKGIRLRNKDAKIVVGGVGVTHQPEIVKLLNADFGIRGDGEESFYELITNFNHDIKGLVYRERGAIRWNGSAKILSLDELPFPQVLQHRYRFPIFRGRIYTMITSRGCVYDCVFCGVPHKKEFRKRSARNIFEEMCYLKEKNYEYIDFKDDCFTIDRQRVRELCDFIIKNRLEIMWGAETRADLVDYDLLKVMKKAKCHNLRFGVESGVERVRNEILGKTLRDKDVFSSVRWCRELGIRTIAYFLLGNPTETLKEMLETIGFIRRLRPDYIDITFTLPILGSRLYKMAVEEGKIPRDIWERTISDNYQIPLYIPNGITLAQMKKVQRKGFRQHYCRIDRLFNEVKNIRRPSDILYGLKAAYILSVGDR